MKNDDVTGGLVFAFFVLVAGWLMASAWTAAWIVAQLVGRAETFGAHPMRAAKSLVQNPTDMALAWGVPLPVSAFWCVFGFLVTVSLLVCTGLNRLFRRKSWGVSDRERLGSQTEARIANVRDLEPLWVDWPPHGRLLLGRTIERHRGRPRLLATEWRDAPSRRRLSPQGEARRNDRGAVCVIGPSRSGKSVNVIAGILAWDGPVILSSVKDDLLAPTLAHRRRQGEVGVFDPTETLQMMYAGPDNAPDGWDDRLVVGWSPLRAADSAVGSARAARALADAGPERAASASGGSNEMWINLAEQLVRGLFFVARFAHFDIGKVVQWVMTQDRPTQDGDGQVATLVCQALEDPDPQVREAAERAATALEGVWSQDAKIVSSIYVTAATLIEPWMSPAVERSAQGRSVDLDWLTSGTNSLYVTAAPQDAKRLSTVYGGIINDLLEQCFTHAMVNGPIDPPLLIVLDEAANLPLARLPEFVSLVAGLGVQLVTVWQSLAQVKTLYGEAADTVLTNHLTKVVFPGVSDIATLDYLSALAGEEDVQTRVESAEKMSLFGGSFQTQGTRLAVAPTSVIRSMRAGESMLLHGTLPPAHVAAIPWYRESRFVALQGWAADDGDAGLPSSLVAEPASQSVPSGLATRLGA